MELEKRKTNKEARSKVALMQFTKDREQAALARQALSALGEKVSNQLSGEDEEEDMKEKAEEKTEEEKKREEKEKTEEEERMVKEKQKAEDKKKKKKKTDKKKSENEKAKKTNEGKKAEKEEAEKHKKAENQMAEKAGKEEGEKKANEEKKAEKEEAEKHRKAENEMAEKAGKEEAEKKANEEKEKAEKEVAEEKKKKKKADNEMAEKEKAKKEEAQKEKKKGENERVNEDKEKIGMETKEGERARESRPEKEEEKKRKRYDTVSSDDGHTLDWFSGNKLFPTGKKSRDEDDSTLIEIVSDTMSTSDFGNNDSSTGEETALSALDVETDKDTVIARLERENAWLSNRNMELEKEATRLRQLNLSYQERIIPHLCDVLNTKKELAVAGSSGAAKRAPWEEFESKDGRKVSIGHGYCLPMEDLTDALNKSFKPSLFVRYMAEKILGSECLMAGTITGSKNKQTYPPDRVFIIKECLRTWLTLHGEDPRVRTNPGHPQKYTEEEIRKEMENFNYYLHSAKSDSIKLMKKNQK